MTSPRSTLREREENFTEAYMEYRSVVRHLHAKLQRTQHQLSICTNKIQDLEREGNERDAIIRKVQESAFAQVDPAEWKPDEDSVVTCALQDLDRAIQRWSRNFAFGPFTSWPSLPTAEGKSFGRPFEDFVLMDSNGKFPKAFEHGKLTGKIYAMLAQAWASDHIYRYIIARPFFFIDELYAVESSSDDLHKGIASRVLQRIMSDAMQGEMFEDNHMRA